MKVYGYCRVSTRDQDNFKFHKQIKDEYPNAAIHNETDSGGRNWRDRHVIRGLIDKIMSEGDKLVVPSLDRLSRDLENQINLLKHAVEEKGLRVHIMDLGITAQRDESTKRMSSMTSMLLNILGSVHQGYRDQLREKTVLGLNAKIDDLPNGERRYKNGKPVGSQKRCIRPEDRDDIEHLHYVRGRTFSEIAEVYSCSRSAVGYWFKKWQLTPRRDLRLRK